MDTILNVSFHTFVAYNKNVERKKEKKLKRYCIAKQGYYQSIINKYKYSLLFLKFLSFINNTQVCCSVIIIIIIDTLYLLILYYITVETKEVLLFEWSLHL